MATACFSLGSNIDPEKNLRLGVKELRERLGPLTVSPVYRNRAAGFAGDDFLNLAAVVETDVAPEQIQEEIERIHRLAGRQRGKDRFASRPLDIDLLLYDELVVEEPGLRLPRRDVLEYSFVLGPLAEIVPGFRHPQTGRTLAAHWSEFDQASHPLTRIDGMVFE